MRVNIGFNDVEKKKDSSAINFNGFLPIKNNLCLILIDSSGCPEYYTVKSKDMDDSAKFSAYRRQKDP